MKRLLWSKKGFTLIELLVAIAILSLVIMAISTTFISQRRSGLSQEDVAESQQSARIGLETLVRDVRKAGLMIPAGTDPIENPAAFNITLLIGSEMDGYATIVDPADTDGNITGLNSPITFTVDNARDFLNRTGSFVRVIRPTTGSDAGKREGADNVCYTVKYLTTTTLQLTYSSGTLPGGGIPAINFKPGDSIVLHDCGHPWPVKVQYSLSPDPTVTPGDTVPRGLTRWVDANSNGIIDVGESEIITSNIITNGNNLFTYLDVNGNATADTASIAAVNVNLTTATSRNVAQVNNQSRTRQLTSLARIMSVYFKQGG